MSTTCPFDYVTSWSIFYAGIIEIWEYYLIHKKQQTYVVAVSVPAVIKKNMGLFLL